MSALKYDRQTVQDIILVHRGCYATEGERVLCDALRGAENEIARLERLVPQPAGPVRPSLFARIAAIFHRATP
jgi:hypothetical protein